MSREYRGCILDPRAFELADGAGWKAEVDIAEDVEHETIDTPFFLKEVFPTKEAALSAALIVGSAKSISVSSRTIFIPSWSNNPSFHRRTGTD
jgi:hypothetical protein